MNQAMRAVAACVMAALIGIGCESRSTTPESSSSSNGKPRVALVMKSLANEFFRTMQDGAEAHQKAHSSDYDLISIGIKNETDVDKQIGLVEQQIAQHVNAIVIAPADSKALVPVLKKAV